MQYIIPDNIAALISNLTDSDVKNDSQIVAYSSTYAKLTATVTETLKMLENDPNWFINTHWRVAQQPTTTDKQHQMIPIRHNKHTFVGDSENSDIRKPQMLTQPKMLSEMSDQLISDGSQSVSGTVSSGIVLESVNRADPVQIEIVTETDRTDDDKHNMADKLDQLNNFPIIDTSNSSDKSMSNGEHTLSSPDIHDSGFISGFISGKGFTNT